jgi:hypothetical protein
LELDENFTPAGFGLRVSFLGDDCILLVTVWGFAGCVFSAG